MATAAIVAVAALILIVCGGALILTLRGAKGRATAPAPAMAARVARAKGADAGSSPKAEKPASASPTQPARAVSKAPPPLPPAAGAKRNASKPPPRKPAKPPLPVRAKPGGGSARPFDENDDEIEMTLVTTRPALGDLPALSSLVLDDDDTPLPRRATAIPIVFDPDAAVDEPTRVERLILVSAVGQTDRGQRRKKNEDSFAMVEDHDLFVVADGMGGHAGGEVASKIAVDVMAAAFRDESFQGEPYPDVPRRGGDLARAIQMANAAIYAQARAEVELTGMGTTVVSAAFSPKKQRVYIGHVGDSRCYRLRDGELAQITTDHTMGNAGITGPLAEHLERAVGIATVVKVDIIIGRPQPGDLYLLCSDGLTKMVKPDAIRDILLAERAAASAAASGARGSSIDDGAAASKPLESAVAALIARANASGGRDNITVILVEVKMPPSAA